MIDSEAPAYPIPGGWPTFDPAELPGTIHEHDDGAIAYAAQLYPPAGADEDAPPEPLDSPAACARGEAWDRAMRMPASRWPRCGGWRTFALTLGVRIPGRELTAAGDAPRAATTASRRRPRHRASRGSRSRSRGGDDCSDPEKENGRRATAGRVPTNNHNHSVPRIMPRPAAARKRYRRGGAR